MLKEKDSFFLCVYLCFLACSENTAGITEEENPGLAFEMKNPTSYDLWSFDGLTENGDDGYWFKLNDPDDEPTATITLPTSHENNVSGSKSIAAVDTCGGICGTVEFAKSSKSLQSVSIGFRLNKDDLTVDASAWNGLCMTYESEFDMRLRFSPGKDDATDGNDMPFAEFPKVAKIGTRCAMWDDFRQSHSGAMTGVEAAKKLSAVLFEFVGKSKQKGAFNIKGLGSYKDVESQQNGEKKPLSSSSAAHEECIYEPIHDMWYGPDSEFQIETGLDNGMAAYGYWFDFVDPAHKAELEWPVPKGNDFDEESIYPIIETCGGICGKAYYKGEGFVGVGFHIVGDVSVDNNEPALGDAENWEGLCVTYSSDYEMDVVMSDAKDSIASHVPSMPKVTLPVSFDVTTKCVKWSEFKNPEGDLGNASRFRSLLFVFYDNGKSDNSFNIVGLGKYHEPSNAGCITSKSSSSVTAENFGFYSSSSVELGSL